MLTAYARYGGFNGFGMLLHAQLSYWGPGTQLLKVLFSICHVYCIYGEFATSKPGASTGCCLRRVRILQNGLFQPGSASGGSES